VKKEGFDIYVDGYRGKVIRREARRKPLLSNFAAGNQAKADLAAARSLGILS
jgi:hypothetical protein